MAGFERSSKDEGQLEVIIGPMFSGKTSELIRRIQRYHLASYRCLIIKHSIMEKFFSTTSVTSHDGHSLPAIVASDLKDIHKIIEDFDVVGIDEGHLFSDLISFCETESDNGKKVIVAALDSCGENIFRDVLGLIPLSESVTKLKAICMSCSGDANFTKFIQNEDIEMPGRPQKYISVCGDCYLSSNHRWRSPFKNYLSPGTSPA